MQSILRNYLVWIILGVLLIVFLVVQFVLVRDRRAAIMEGNRRPVAMLKEADAMRKQLGQLATRGDMAEVLHMQSDIRNQHLGILRQLRDMSDGINRWMGNGLNPLGEVFDPRTGVDDPADPGRRIGYRPVEWPLFAPTLQALYAEMLNRAGQRLVERRQPAVEKMLADRYYAGDVLTKMAEARERAREEALVSTLAQVNALWAGQLAAFNPVTNVDETFNPARRPADMQRGWRMWREYLIRRDILERVLPAAAVEMDVEYWAREPLEEAARDRYVDDRRADRLAAEQLDRGSRAWKGRATRFVERISPVRVLEVRLGDVTLPVDAQPGESGASIPEGRIYDSYRIETTIVAHPAVVSAFITKLMDVDGDMLYVPVSTAIKCFPEAQTLNPAADAAVAGTGASASAADAAVRLAAGYDYEPPVEARLVLDLYRFRFSDTDNETADEAAGEEPPY